MNREYFSEILSSTLVMEGGIRRGDPGEESKTIRAQNFCKICRIGTRSLKDLIGVVHDPETGKPPLPPPGNHSPLSRLF